MFSKLSHSIIESRKTLSFFFKEFKDFVNDIYNPNDIMQLFKKNQNNSLNELVKEFVSVNY